MAEFFQSWYRTSADGKWRCTRLTVGEEKVTEGWESTDNTTKDDNGQRPKGDKTTEASKGAHIVKEDKTSKGSKTKPIKKQPAGKATKSK